MPAPLDEYPIHQAPISMRHPATSDRNFYDRCYFNAHDRSGEVFLVTGLGVYPNLGVTDGFATVRRGDQQVTVRFSDALGDDRLAASVGPLRVEVLRPLEEIRLVCEADDHGIGFDLTWRGSFPAVEEPRHQFRQSDRLILDACRFAQVGTWSGTLRVDGSETTVTPERWVGTRDRSWGIRPVGEAEPGGRGAAETPADFGFWWTYVPLRFEDFALIVIAQEDGDGTRILNQADRIWPVASGRPVEQLGWTDFDIRYAPGTRHPLGATLHLAERGGNPVTVEVETLTSVALNCGPGYGGGDDWSHGEWRGRDWVERSVCDPTADDMRGRALFGTVDHVARATCGEAEGWGLFEHAVMGRHTPTGFDDWGSMAP